jgi:uncharacterized protein (UPF0332 family)
VNPLKTVDDCFERGLLRRVEPSHAKADQSLFQAREWLSEAEASFKAGAYRSALSSSYMAVFHSARAILLRDGVREKSHYCTGVYIQKYVEEGFLEEDWPMLFDRMRSVRHADQYSFQPRPAEEEVKAGLELAERFIDRMARLLEESHSEGMR